MRLCKGEVGGNSRLDAAFVARSYMATLVSVNQTKRTVDKLLVSSWRTGATC